jgi:two-component system, cell cycle sensor histidine kinase and response regulator CckA
LLVSGAGVTGVRIEMQRSNARNFMGVSPATGERGLLLIIGLTAIVSALLLLWVAGDAVLAAAFMASVFAIGALVFAASRLFPARTPTQLEFDWSLVHQAADNDEIAIAVTDRIGRLVCANALHDRWFGGPFAPPALGLSSADEAALMTAGRVAWRDGRSEVLKLHRNHISFDAQVLRCGRSEDHLIWRFRATQNFDLVTEAHRLINSPAGTRIGEAGMMVVLVGADGRIQTATQGFVLRAGGRVEAQVAGRDLVTLLETGRDGAVRFVNEGPKATPLRLLQIPVEPESPATPTLIILLDDDSRTVADDGHVGIGHVQSLLGVLPLGLALADRDGRFLYLNDAFCRAVNLPSGSKPIYPGDLVVREDKAAVADSVRRFATGQAMTGDIAVRLRDQPDEPVALTIAGARGLGEAAVLLSIKDNSEESKLKKQVAQATKMQAVGQLAGGVAHDFNNILTGIIGHCDLMLMRHTPGDSDYDDIQQIKNNSNRAASLTRQLLAFSRQQTLRPQILQLPDIVAEISNLLQRLLGETVTLIVKHGRSLGAVRADPGQLEQVIVNLVVNARDAMPRGGTVTIQTYAVSTAEVRKLGSDILPITDYTALSISDTGTGIVPELLPKIFEPFFTTKDVGKGTGLGLSTVYGIVKQSGGFIFADSKVGIGTSFVIYLPVYRDDVGVVAAPIKSKPKPAETWGSGLILLVEDEDMVRAVAERALTRNGYTVITAANGEAALEILDSRKDVNLIVSDVVMPVMDGPTMVRQARIEFPTMPILFMSGYAEEQLRKMIDLENIAFLPKPFSVQQLAEAVRDIMVPR